MRADGWSDAKLRELVVAGGLQTGPFGGQLHADEYVADGVPVVMPQDIISGEISTEHIARVSEEKAASLAQHRLRTGDLVFARRGDIGRVGMARDRENGWLCGTGCLRARPSERVSPVYLHYAVRRASSIAWLNIHAVGQTMLNLNTSILGQLPADVPPLPEQRAIAAVLDSLDDAIQKTEQIIAKLQQVKQGLLHDLLTRGIDDNGELRDPERHPEQFQDSPLGRIPKGWEVKQLREVAEISKLAGFEYTLHFRYCEDGEVIAIRPLNIKNERIELSDVQRITKRVSDALPRSKLDADDVIFTYIGAYVGEVAIVHESNRFHLAPNICRIRAGLGTSSCFLMWTLRSHLTQRQIARLVAVTATPSMTMASVRSLLVRVSPLAQQLEIVHRIEAAHERLRAEECVAVSLRSLKVGIAEDLLTGRVRTTSLPGFSA